MQTGDGLPLIAPKNASSENSDFIPRFFAVAAVVVLILMGSLAVMTEKLFGGAKGFIALSLFIAAGIPFLQRPLWGLYVMGFVSYLFPQNTNIAGIPRAAPGLLLSIFIFVGAFGRFIFGTRRFRLNWIWVLLTIMFAFHFLRALQNPVLGNGRIINFIQGITPFIIYSLIIKNEKQGRNVLLFWTIAYSIFCLFVVIIAAYDGPTAIFSLQSAARIRTKELGGFNPNSLGWTALLYLPFAILYTIETKKPLMKIVWGCSFAGLGLLIIFSFSRAAMIGMFMTFVVLSLFSIMNNRRKNISVLMLALSASLLLYNVWNLSVSEKIIAKDRSINEETFKSEVDFRWGMIMEGWKAALKHPFAGIGFNTRTMTHSYFTKMAVEFGIPYLILSVIPFIFIIKSCVSLLKIIEDKNEKTAIMAILTAGIVALPQSLFGITLVSAGYAQVFWMFVAYVQLALSIHNPVYVK